MISKKTFSLFRSGDDQATSKVYEEYRNLVFFIIATYVSNKEDCNDILSETFLKLLKNKDSISSEKNLKQFVCSIAKNEAINFIKKENQLQKVQLIEETIGENDRTNDVLNAIEETLSNKETIVVYYKAVFDFTWDEITKETGIPSSSARAIYNRAKEKLREELR